MKNIRFVFIALATFAPLTGCASPSATVKVRVVDEERTPISGVHSELINIFDDGTIRTGFTDVNGLYSKHLIRIYEVNGHFEKFGYYKTSGVFWEAPQQWGDVPPADTNFVITMRRIIDPVPMTRRRIETYLPRNDEPVGFDLATGDWVAPYGKGTQADIVFTGTMRYVNQLDRDVTIEMLFPNELCGIQSFIRAKMNDNIKVRSELIPPHSAPEDGYVETFKLWKVIDNPHYPKSHQVFNQNYIFRTRVVTDNEGKIIKANYGWTVGDFEISPNRNNRIWLRFTYYYNPDPKSRSLEPKEVADRQWKTQGEQQ